MGFQWWVSLVSFHWWVSTDGFSLMGFHWWVFTDGFLFVCRLICVLPPSTRMMCLLFSPRQVSTSGLERYKNIAHLCGTVLSVFHNTNYFAEVGLLVVYFLQKGVITLQWGWLVVGVFSSERCDHFTVITCSSFILSKTSYVNWYFFATQFDHDYSFKCMLFCFAHSVG